MEEETKLPCSRRTLNNLRRCSLLKEYKSPSKRWTTHSDCLPNHYEKGWKKVTIQSDKHYLSQAIKVNINNHVILIVDNLDTMWWEQHFASVFFPKIHSHSLTMRKVANYNWGAFYINERSSQLSVIKNSGGLSNCHNQEELQRMTTQCHLAAWNRKGC